MVLVEGINFKYPWLYSSYWKPTVKQECYYLWIKEGLLVWTQGIRKDVSQECLCCHCFDNSLGYICFSFVVVLCIPACRQPLVRWTLESQRMWWVPVVTVIEYTVESFDFLQQFQLMDGNPMYHLFPNPIVETDIQLTIVDIDPSTSWSGLEFGIFIARQGTALHVY